MNLLSNAAEVLGFIVLVVSSLTALGKYFIFNPLRKEIKQATYPISPGANGGLSLPDVARKLDKMEQRQNDTDTKIDLIIEILKK